MLFALFLIGWGLSMLWGPIADRFGRVRTLTLTILCYSLFTLLCGVVTNIWQLAAFRLLAGIGIGGEWFIGATFVAEEWPEDRRKAGAGYMHTGYYFGFFLAALANYFVGAKYGWRWMFVVGGTPALLVTFIRYGVRESATWRQRVAEQHRPAMIGGVREDLLRRPTRGGRCSTRSSCSCRSSACGRARSTCRRRCARSRCAKASPRPTRRASRRTARWCSRPGRSSAASSCRRWRKRSAGG